MPHNIVDLSAVSSIIRDEPWHLHFWECTPREYLEFLKNPRAFMAQMGINLPADCRIESRILNHDWMSDHTAALSGDNGTVICNVGGPGNIALNFYPVTSYAHDKNEVGKHKKKLLHQPNEEKVPGS